MDRSLRRPRTELDIVQPNDAGQGEVIYQGTFRGTIPKSGLLAIHGMRYPAGSTKFVSRSEAWELRASRMHPTGWFLRPVDAPVTDPLPSLHSSMESNHPNSAGSGSRRVGRTQVLVLGALVAAGAWTLQDRSWFSSPEIAERVETVDDNAESPATPDVKGSPVKGKIELTSHEAVVPSADSSETNGQPIETDEERGRRQVVGDWEDDYQGHRRLTVHADGTATMVVEPSGMGRKLFAERLSFDIEWTFADGKIVMLTTGGEPKSKTNLIINLYGTRAEYKLLNLNEKELVLLDADGKTKYEWRRMKSAPRDP